MTVHNLIDLSGKRFGRLTVLQKAETRYGAALWLCLCDCGIPSSVRSFDLRSGRIKSCGCFRSEVWKGIRRKQVSA